MADLKRREQAAMARPGVRPTFAIASNLHFEKVLTIEPRYDLAIFDRGEVFHSGHFHAPERMVNAPLTERLTANAFFRLRMPAGREDATGSCRGCRPTASSPLYQ